MGTTLHAHIEVKKNNTWFHFAAPDVERNYILFAAMNGERINSIPSSYKIKPQASHHGLPADITEVTKICYEQDKKGYHIHGEGTLTAENIKNLQNHLWEVFPHVPKKELDLEETIFHTYINGNTIASHHGWDDVRIVFWYDN